MDLNEILNSIVDAIGPSEAEAIDKSKILKALTPALKDVKGYAKEAPAIYGFSEGTPNLRSYLNDLKLARTFIDRYPQKELDAIDAFNMAPLEHNPAVYPTRWLGGYRHGNKDKIMSALPVYPYTFVFNRNAGTSLPQVLGHELGHHRTLSEFSKTPYWDRYKINSTDARAFAEVVADLEARKLLQKYLPEHNLGTYLASPDALGGLERRYPITKISPAAAYAQNLYKIFQLEPSPDDLIDAYAQTILKLSH